MRVKEIYLLKTPFDDTYINVPDILDNGNLKDALLTYLTENFDYMRVTIPNAPRVIPINTNINVVISGIYGLVTDENARYYNYMCIIPDLPNTNDKHFYFIKNCQINNATQTISVSYNCTKDIWVENYGTLSENNRNQMIVRKHFKNYSIFRDNIVVSRDFYNDDDGSNVQYISNEITLFENEFDVLWQRIFLDPSKDWYVSPQLYLLEEDLRTEVQHYNGFSGPLYCVYRPLRVYNKNSVKIREVDRVYDRNANEWSHLADTSTFNLNLDSSYVVGMDLTFNAPFTSISYNVINLQKRLTVVDSHAGQLEYKDGDRYVPIGNGIVFNYTGGIVTETETDYSDLFEGYSFRKISNYLDEDAPSVDVYDISHFLAEAVSPPYNTVMVKTPNSTFPLVGKGSLFTFKIYRMLTPLGLSYRFKSSFYHNQGMEPDYNIENVVSANNFPFAVTSYSQFKEQSSRSFDARYTNALETNSANRRIANIEANAEIIGGVATFAKGVGTTASLGFPTSDLVEGGSQVISGIAKKMKTNYLSDIERGQLNRTRDAQLEDIQNGTSAINGVNTGGSDLTFLDRCTFFGKTATGTNFKTMLIDYYKYGTPRRCYTDFLENTRTRYDFVQTVDCDLPMITNDYDRATMEGIFNRGVTKWHFSEQFSPPRNLNPFIPNVQYPRLVI